MLTALGYDSYHRTKRCIYLYFAASRLGRIYFESSVKRISLADGCKETSGYYGEKVGSLRTPPQKLLYLYANRRHVRLEARPSS